MAKKRVYVETSVISDLTAKPAREVVKLARQQQTRDWWEHRKRWELFISPGVMREIQRGDRNAARLRVTAVLALPLLPETDEVIRLANQLIDDGLIHEKVRDDALHIASATIHGMDYLATWNQKHLNNPFRIEALYAAIRKLNWAPPVLVRPDNMLEDEHGA